MTNKKNPTTFVNSLDIYLHVTLCNNVLSHKSYICNERIRKVNFSNRYFSNTNFVVYKA